MGPRFCSCFHLLKSTKNKHEEMHNGSNLHNAPKNLRVFTYNELKSATGNFHISNKIGRGGFGIVYMGTLRDGSKVAIKSLSTESKQGITEFLTEIDVISNVKHPNLLQLVGCCAEGSNRLLVYEYMENNSLANALLGPKNRRIVLDWPKRYAIILGTARGLSFLHEEAVPHIVHRDIKASNILLDKDLVPKIGDFGLAKLFPDTVTHISTRVAGTMGYLAPEYALLGQLTKRADVYSFGVLMLEIISGRNNGKSSWEFDATDLLERAWKLRLEDRLLDIVDPELNSYQEEELLRFIKVVLLCTQATATSRPSMDQVVEMLSNGTFNIPDVKDLTQPGVVRKSLNPSSSSSSSTSYMPYKIGQPSNTYAFMTTSRNVDSSAMSMTEEIEPR